MFSPSYKHVDKNSSPSNIFTGKLAIMNNDFSKLDLTTSLMANAAQKKGIPCHVHALIKPQSEDEKHYWLGLSINDRKLLYRYGIMIEVGKGRHNRLGRNINHRAELLVANKHGTKSHLTEHGFNVPKGEMFRRRHKAKALAFYDALPKPLCVKPNNGRLGRCVTASIHDYENYEKAVNLVAGQYKTIVIEESVIGQHFRFFYCHPKIVAVKVGLPLGVTGDGNSNISKLIEHKNAERAVRALPSHPQIEMEEDILRNMAAQGYTIKSVPKNGERVMLRFSSGAPAGADSISFDLDTLHPSYLDIIARACQSVPGLYYCGVDIVTEDIYAPATQSNYWILELNANPDFISLYYPWEGPVTDVAGEMIDTIRLYYPFE